jgi:Fe-S-cluster-containing hydrogenase component 2
MIILDLDKCLESKDLRDRVPQLYSLLEKGVRVAICRHCENPPCVAACPVDALEKPDGSDIKRHLMKCVSCKQCSVACPVGANPAVLLNYRTFSEYDINVEKCRKLLPEGTIDEVDELPEGYVEVYGGFAVKALKWK